MSGSNRDSTDQPFTMNFPCSHQCECRGRGILNCLQVTTAESHLFTLEDLQKQLNDKVLGELERLKDKSDTTEFEEVHLRNLNNEERINFLDILDQSLAEGRASSEYSIRCKLLMKRLSNDLGRLPRSFYKTALTVTQSKYNERKAVATIHLGTLNYKRDVINIVIKEPRLSISDIHREAITWRYLDPRHILPFLGVADVKPYGVCLLSPFMEKGDIRDYIEHNPASDIQLMDFIIQIVEGISYLHKMDIIHADIKPDNILVDRENKAIIADVGIAYLGNIRTITAKATRSATDGTFRYMAPELRVAYVDGAKIRPTKKSDVFSLGVTIYEVLMEKKEKIVDWRRAWDDTKTRNGGFINKDVAKGTISPCWKRPASRPNAPKLLENLKLHTTDIFSEETGWTQYIFSKLGEKKKVQRIGAQV